MLDSWFLGRLQRPLSQEEEMREKMSVLTPPVAVKTSNKAAIFQNTFLEQKKNT